MGLSSQELGEIRAQWEEWVPDGFELSIEVKAAEVSMYADVGDTSPLSARAEAELYCQVDVWALEHTYTNAASGAENVPLRSRLVFSERVPHDAGALRASVTVLARTIAERQRDG